MMIFDYEVGNFIHTVSDSMAMDSGGNLMIKLSDNMAIEKCECGTTMLFLELYFNHKRVSLEEMYEKAMSRSRGRRSSV